MKRDTLLRSFLRTTDWRNSEPVLLAGDASNRTYFRVQEANGTCAVIMDAPPEKGEDIRPFIDVTQRLRLSGFSAPNIYASDPEHGFLILEDLGDDLFAQVLRTDTTQETEFYQTAVDLLVELHTAPETSSGLAPYDQATCLREAQLITNWYLPAASGPVSQDCDAEYADVISTLCADLMPDQPVLVMRDYHAENLLWLPGRPALERIGLLDYQDALAGHPAYDLVSLLEDARRDISATLQADMLAHYITTSGVAADSFRRAYAILGAQRNLKILGIFARLSKRDHKPIYIDHMPRVWGYLQNDLLHPALADLKSWVDQYLPEPTAAIREKLAAQE